MISFIIKNSLDDVELTLTTNYSMTSLRLDVRDWEREGLKGNPFSLGGENL